MVRVSVEDIQRDLAGYLTRVRAGESLLVTSGDKPIAEVKPVGEGASGGRRPAGLASGDFAVPDDFDAPLPDDVLNAFEGR